MNRDFMLVFDHRNRTVQRSARGNGASGKEQLMRTVLVDPSQVVPRRPNLFLPSWDGCKPLRIWLLAIRPNTSNLFPRAHMRRVCAAAGAPTPALRAHVFIYLYILYKNIDKTTE